MSGKALAAGIREGNEPTASALSLTAPKRSLLLNACCDRPVGTGPTHCSKKAGKANCQPCPRWLKTIVIDSNRLDQHQLAMGS